MTDTIKVAISPFYKGMGWIDAGTQLKFKSGALMKYYTIPKNRDLTGIKRSVMLNQLILVEGNLDDVEDIQDNTQALEQEISNLKKQIAQLEKELEEEKEKNSRPEPEPETEPEEELEAMTEGIQAQAEKHVFEDDENESLYSQQEAEDLTVVKIKEILDAKEIDYESNAKKAELVELLVGLPK